MKNYLYPLVGLLSLGIAACSTTTAPVSELTEAKAYVQTAKNSDADTLAAEHYQRAINNLQFAQDSMDKQNYEQALWAAEKSTADAKLAEASAQTIKMKEKLAALNKSIEALEQSLADNPQ